MWRMTEDEYRQLLQDMQDRNRGKNSKRQPDPSNGIKAKAKGKKRVKAESKGKYRIVVTARRVRAIDPDNVFCKFAIDELVRAGVLPDDSSKFIEEITKKVEKVKSSSDEATIIEVWKQEG